MTTTTQQLTALLDQADRALMSAECHQWLSHARKDISTARTALTKAIRELSSKQAAAAQAPEGFLRVTHDQVERHATTAWECPPQSMVVLLSSLQRLHKKNSGNDAHQPGGCSKAPAGWKCTRTAGHDGPCAAEKEQGGE